MLPREEPLSINWSSLKHKHVTGPARILQLKVQYDPHIHKPLINVEMHTSVMLRTLVEKKCS